MPVEATLVTTLRDLGVPTLLGAVIGADINYMSAKQRAKQDSARALDAGVVARERKEAEIAMAMLDEFRVRFINTPVSPANWVEPTMMWNQLVEHTNWIRDPEIRQRLETLSLVISLVSAEANQATAGAGAGQALHSAVADVDRALRAFTLNRIPYPREMPSADELSDMLIVDGRLDFDRLRLRDVPSESKWLDTPRKP